LVNITAGLDLSLGEFSEVGDTIRFGLVNGPVGLARLAEKSESNLKLELEYSNEEPTPHLAISLVLAIPRPKVARRLIQAICSMGVQELHLINSHRVDKSYWQSHYLDEQQLQQQLVLGLEQSGSTFMPKVFQHRLFRPFVEDLFPSLIKNKVALLAHPYAGQDCPTGLNQPSVLVVGPEGGFTEFEVAMLEAQGATAVALGQRILRVETAVPALIGRLQRS
jgi:RsmE family RNA methyltransferase